MKKAFLLILLTFTFNSFAKEVSNVSTVSSVDEVSIVKEISDVDKVSTVVKLKEVSSVSKVVPVKEVTSEVIKEHKVLIGYYGRPYSKALGVLGHTDIPGLITRLKKVTKPYNDISSNIKAQETFHIIFHLATKEAGRDGDYIKPLKESILIEYLEAAKKENFAVIIDLQLGALTPLNAIKSVLKFLKYPNVHLAIDPEFKIPSHKRYPPGKFLGHIFGKDVNEVQEAMNDYLIQNDIKGKRKLFIHMFHKKMLRKREVIKNYEHVELVYNVDGHGAKASKIKIFNSLYNKKSKKVATSGFKLFYVNDQKPLLNPKQVLGLETFGKSKIKLNAMPVYINYQ